INAGARARSLVAQAAADVQAGSDASGTLKQLADAVRPDVGDVPPEIIAGVLRDKVDAKHLKAMLWTPMRRQLIDRCVAEYRSRHTIESAFYDMTDDPLGTVSPLASLLFDGPSDKQREHKTATWGQDALWKTLDASLPTDV